MPTIIKYFAEYETVVDGETRWVANYAHRGALHEARDDCAWLRKHTLPNEAKATGGMRISKQTMTWENAVVEGADSEQDN